MRSKTRIARDDYFLNEINSEYSSLNMKAPWAPEEYKYRKIKRVIPELVDYADKLVSDFDGEWYKPLAS